MVFFKSILNFLTIVCIGNYYLIYFKDFLINILWFLVMGKMLSLLVYSMNVSDV